MCWGRWDFKSERIALKKNMCFFFIGHFSKVKMVNQEAKAAAAAAKASKVGISKKPT